MPYKTEVGGYHIPPEHDARRKLDDDDRAKIRALRAADPVKWSMYALAREFNVSKRLIQFTVHPERHAASLAARKARGGYVNERTKHAEYMRKHRARKYKLLLEGKLTHNENADA